MTFIIYSVQLLLAYAWMCVLMFCAIEVAIYALTMAIKLIELGLTGGWRELAKHPVNALKCAHKAAALNTTTLAFLRV